jgi:hypothetical protein
VTLQHSFEYEEANHEFQEVAQRDPQCAILGHHGPVSPTLGSYIEGQSAPLRGTAAKTQDLKAPTARERDYIQALLVFWTDTEKLNHNQRASAHYYSRDNPAVASLAPLYVAGYSLKTTGGPLMRFP